MRLSKLRRLMSSKGVEALLITQESNVKYFTGLPFAEGTYLLALHNDVKALTPALDYWRVKDSLKDIEVMPYGKYELPDAEVKPVTTKLSSWIAEYLISEGITQLGLDADPHSATALKIVKSAESKVSIVDLSKSVTEMRSVKDQDEVEAIVKALSISERAFERTLEEIKAGMSEYEVAALLEGNMRSLGAEGYAFETIVASGPNAAYPHTIPSSRRIMSGDPVVIDFGARYKGYCADITRLVIINGLSNKLRKCVKAVEEALNEAVSVIEAGIKAAEVDSKARNVLRKYGLNKYFIHGLGHGVGVDVHESPILSPSSEDTVLEGMVVTVEPGVYIHGELGVRVENMVYVTSSGAKVLNRTPLTSIIDLG